MKTRIEMHPIIIHHEDGNIHSVQTNVDIDIDISIDELQFMHSHYKDTLDKVMEKIKK